MRDPDVYRFLVQHVDADTSLIGFMQRIGQQVAVVVGEQLRAAGQDRVDDGRRHEIHLLDRTFCVRGERIGERLHRFRRDRQAGSCTVAAVADPKISVARPRRRPSTL